MSSVSGGVPNLVQGVSQQSRRDRRDGQCTQQENMSSDIVRNLSRRAGTHLQSVLLNTPDTHEYHTLDTEDGVHFLLVKDSALLAFNNVGAAVPVVGGTDTYISEEMVSTVIDGEMWLADVATETAMSPDVHEAETRGIVQVLGGQYGRTYTLNMKYPPDPGVEIVITYTTPDGSTVTDIEDTATDAIATELKATAEGFGNFNDHYTVERRGDVLLFEWKPASAGFGTRMEITSDDGEGGFQLIAVTDRTDRVAYLPRYAPDGYVVKVTGIVDQTDDDVYFQFTQEVAGFGNEGVWEEAVARGVTYSIDANTMPHVLTYDPVATEFTFAPGVWDTMQAGDKDTNPEPSFIGNMITDLASFQGRMCILTAGTLVMSRTNSINDYFIGSATTIVASDPIDIGSTAKSANNLKYLIPHNRDLVVFSDKAQFIVFGRTSLTPSNASLVLSTEFQVNTDIRPSLSGRNIFFVSDYGMFSSVREFYTEGNTDANDSRPITTHVNKYIPSGMRTLASSSNYDAMLLHSTDGDAYLYQFLWEDSKKLQSSWSKWSFTGNLLFSYFDRSLLYLVLKTSNDDITLCTLNFDNEADDGVDYEVHLDRKQVSTSASILHTLVNADENLAAVQGAGCANPGLTAQIGSVDVATGVVTMQSTYTGELIFGVPYLSIYKPTMPMIKDQNKIKIGTGRLILRRMLASFENTGTFRTGVTSKYAAKILDYMSGRILGDPENVVGEQPIIDGKFNIRIGDDADLVELEIYSDSHTPFTLVELEWEGQWTRHGTRR